MRGRKERGIAYDRSVLGRSGGNVVASSCCTLARMHRTTSRVHSRASSAATHAEGRLMTGHRAPSSHVRAHNTPQTTNRECVQYVTTVAPAGSLKVRLPHKKSRIPAAAVSRIGEETSAVKIQVSSRECECGVSIKNHESQAKLACSELSGCAAFIFPSERLSPPRLLAPHSFIAATFIALTALQR